MPNTIKSERKLLKQILELADPDGKVYLMRLDRNCNPYLLDLLKSANLIEFCDYDLWGNNPKSVKLTSEGRLFFERRHEDAMLFIKERLATPLVVSFITTLITMLLGHILAEWL